MRNIAATDSLFNMAAAAAMASCGVVEGLRRWGMEYG
jgi:hypothetical protein